MLIFYTALNFHRKAMTGKFLLSLVPSSGQVALLSLVTLQLQRMKCFNCVLIIILDIPTGLYNKVKLEHSSAIIQHTTANPEI